MSILITGGAGFIGSHLAAHFQGRERVRILDNFRTGHRRNLAGLDVELVEGSITDRAAVRAAMRGVDRVFHLAAMVSVPESVERPRECVETNVTGLLHVLEEAAAAGVRRLCFSSSAAVYGENPASPKTEDLTPDPRSPYAITKLDGEYYCRLFAAAGRLETVALRYFNVFGPRQDPGSAYAAAVPIFIQRALARRPLTIHGDGLQTRDFVAVRDVVAANVFASTQPGLAGVYNVGYGGQISILDLARRIIAATGSSSAIEHAPARAGDVRHSCADVGRLHAAGFRPASSLDEGLAATIAHFRTAAP
ncbi:MAG: NAD-dependent epimerase/dehydratase family protein [Opitutaceae bacterium]|nr:NAD-dependent epimerase/dehydratase family protein [Opitutaceae bacterium]